MTAQQPFWTSGRGVNAAKSLTLVVICYLAARHGLNDNRKVIYTGLHVGYGGWWYLHQWLAPEWWNARFCFPMERSVLELPIYLLVFGAFYSLPAYLAFTNPAPISASIAVLAIVVSILGNNLNVAADFWKSGQKAAGVKHCSTNIYDGRVGAHPNWAGDWMRYTSFALASGRLLSFTVPASIVLHNYLAQSLMVDPAIQAKKR